MIEPIMPIDIKPNADAPNPAKSLPGPDAADAISYNTHAIATMHIANRPVLT